MTNRDFYAFCRDQRKIEDDPERRTALTAVYNYMRECGVSKQGVAGFLDHCMQECVKNGSSTTGYQWVGQTFSGSGPAVVQSGQATLFDIATTVDLS